MNTAYVVNTVSNNVTAIQAPGNASGDPIAVGNGPGVIAITPDGTAAYVENEVDNTVTPIQIPGNTPGDPIQVDTQPVALAIIARGLHNLFDRA